jgi:hypothetical protein
VSVLVDSLVYRHPDPHVEGFLPPAELLQRVANRFPLAVIDRERGDRIIQEGADRLAELSSPTAGFAEDHRRLLGRVAYVTVREEQEGPQFGFLLYPHPTVIDIDYERPEDRDAGRPLLEALASELAEYDIVSEDPDD